MGHPNQVGVQGRMVFVVTYPSLEVQLVQDEGKGPSSIPAHLSFQEEDLEPSVHQALASEVHHEHGMFQDPFCGPFWLSFLPLQS